MRVAFGAGFDEVGLTLLNHCAVDCDMFRGRPGDMIA